jgi:hypothetical protein
LENTFVRFGPCLQLWIGREECRMPRIQSGTCALAVGSV